VILLDESCSSVDRILMANPEIRDCPGKLRNLLEDSTIVDIIKAVWKCQETNAH